MFLPIWLTGQSCEQGPWLRGSIVFYGIATLAYYILRQTTSIPRESPLAILSLCQGRPSCRTIGNYRVAADRGAIFPIWEYNGLA